MATTSTITIIGKKLGGDNYDAIIEFLVAYGGTVNIDGFVQGTLVEEDGMEFITEAVDGRDPISLARLLISSGRLSTLDCCIKLDGELRYYNFDAHYDNRLVVTLNANRAVLEDGITDYNWHYTNLVSKLTGTVIAVESIAFCDDL